jgi:hypothetical protein
MSAGIGLALTAASALGQYRQGQAQAAGLRSRGQGLLVQADFTRLQGRQEALKSKREAVNQLQAILEALARTTAVAGAGNINPFSGNPEGIKIKALNVGGLNVVVAKENEAITRLVANFQASQYEFAAGQAFRAASAAKSAGITNALFTLGSGLFMFGQAGGFGGSAATTTATGGGAFSATAGSTLRPMLPSPGTFTQPFQFQGFGTWPNPMQRI